MHKSTFRKVISQKESVFQASNSKWSNLHCNYSNLEQSPLQKKENLENSNWAIMSLKFNYHRYSLRQMSYHGCAQTENGQIQVLIQYRRTFCESWQRPPCKVRKMPKTGNDAGFKPINNSILPYHLNGKAKKANHAVAENPSLKNPANAS